MREEFAFRLRVSGRGRHAGVVVACAVVLAFPGCGSGDPPSAGVDEPAEEGAGAAQAAAQPAPLPEFPTASCRIHTEEPGAFVFVDGNRVPDAGGEPVTTPCRVVAAPGSHIVTVAQQGRADRSKQIVFSADETELFFEDVGSGTASAGSLLSAPLLHARVGEATPLEAVNSPGRELDPFVTADGLSLWFAGDRSEGRGIYVATRQSPIEQFGRPRLLELTRGADFPASPSLTGDQKSIVYVVPEKARIWALTRPSPLGDFDERVPLFFDSAAGARWPSAQIHSDGLRIYYLRKSTGDPETRVVIRESLDDRFGRELVVQLPGLHPCLSADGLRQYVFDGTALSRARRSSVQEPFAAAETLMRLSLPGYSPSSEFRQFFVSDDEQWMFYCDDPGRAGDLFVVRLADGPAWGVALRGEPIEPRALARTDTTPPSGDPTETPDPQPAPAPEEPADPRSQPLPYTQFRTQLVQLIQERDYDGAAELVSSGGNIPDLPADSNLVAWDAEDVARLRQFWSDVLDAVAQLAPGDEFRIGSIRVEFVRFENGRLVARARTRELERELVELDPLDVLEIVDAVIDESDVDHQVRGATFLLYEPDVPASARDRRVAAGGERGVELVERFATRLLEQAEAELQRDHPAGAVAFVDRIESDFPDTAAAERSAELRNQLYAAAWRTAGNREWQTGPDGEYTAGAERSDDALLISRREYERFELSMEYRTNTPNGQGGVFFRYAGSGRLYGRCFKIQLTNDKGVAVDEFCTGSLFGIEAPTANAAGNMGEWNTFRMRVDGEDFTVWINGETVIDTDAVDDQIPESGYVALDGIPGGISYRKVLLTDPPR